jgi:hypothetical protein
MFSGTDFSLAGIAPDCVSAVKLWHAFGMIPMAMRKKEIIEQDLPLLDKCLYFSTKAARVNKNPDSGLVVCHQITVDSEAPHGKTPEYQIGHHDTKQFYDSDVPS